MEKAGEAPDCCGQAKLTNVPTDLRFHICKTVTRILRYQYSHLGLKPSPSGWFQLPKLLNVSLLQRFSREPMLETLRTDPHRFVVVDDLIQVVPKGSATRHRQIHAAIPESSSSHSRTLLSLTREGDHKSIDDKTLDKGGDQEPLLGGPPRPVSTGGGSQG